MVYNGPVGKGGKLMSFKKTVAVILLCSVCLSAFSGCSLLDSFLSDSSYDSENLKFYTTEDQEKHALEIKDKIINCLVNADKNGLKEMFSDVALDRVDDIDADIDRLFENYEITKAANDSCKFSMFGENGPDAWAYFTCSCTAVSSTGNVIIQWEEVAIKKHDRSYEGLYSLMITEFYQDMPYYAGILSLEQRDVLWINSFDGAHDHSINDYEAYATEHMTESCANELSGEEIEALAHVLHIHARSYLTWTVKRGDVQYVFIEKFSNHHYFIVCYGVSEAEPNLICHVSAMEYEEGEVPLSDEIIGAGMDFFVDLKDDLVQG